MVTQMKMCGSPRLKNFSQLMLRMALGAGRRGSLFFGCTSVLSPYIPSLSNRVGG